MPAERVAMRDVRVIIRLKFLSSLTTSEIARRLGLARSTVRETLSRFESSDLIWPLPEGLSDEGLETALYANRRSKRGHRRHAEPDWPAVHREMKRKHVTLLIVWDEYIAQNPGGYSYSRYVAARLMWRKPRERAGGPGMSRNINSSSGATDYRAFKNVISEGSGRCHGLVCTPDISTRASAFAFISMSTSA
jgi:DNA-binding transcriptional ArsR family regulator